MEYKLYAYQKGIVKTVYTAQAKSYREAVGQFIDELDYFSHMKVVGRGMKRFALVNGKIKELKDKITMFKITHKEHPSILVLVGVKPEIKHYANKEERNKVFEENTCLTVSTPVESVENGKEQSDTTASSEETSASKSGLTSKKTWNGFVMSATCKDLPTRLNTVKNSGKGKSVGLVEPKWYDGSNLSRSRQTPTLFAKVHIRPGEEKIYPTVTPTMKSWNGDTIQVKKALEMESGKIYADVKDGYYFNSKWLDFEHVSLYLTKDIKETDVMETKSGGMPACGNLKRGIHEFSRCGCGCGLYSCGQIYVHPKYLQIHNNKNRR